MSIPEFDALIVGGGPAGTSAALVLSNAGLSVCLVESSHYDSPRVGEHLLPHVRSMLDALEAWNVVEKSGAIECPGVRSAWGEPELYQRDYLFNINGSGWQLDRARFDRLLASHAELAGTTVCLNTKLGSISRAGGRWDATIVTSNVAKKLNARVLIDASGRRSAVARRLGARRVAFDQLFGVIAWFENPGNPGRTVLVEAVENGWWYSIPLSGNRFVGAFMTDIDFLKGKSSNSLQFFNTFLDTTRHTKERLYAAKVIKGPIVHPANSEILDNISGPGWLAIGDACMSMDPLSSSGIPHALETAMAASSAVIKWLDGEAGALDEYAITQSQKINPYLSKRTQVYREETRWMQNPFWMRRHVDPTSIFLSPDDVLITVKNAKLVVPMTKLGKEGIQKLLQMCQGGNSAKTIVKLFCNTTQHEQSEQSEQVIFALQNLVILGILEWRTV